MNKYTLFVVLAVVFLFPVSTFAGPIIRTGETVSVDASQTVKGDFYGFGSKVIMSGAGENDAYLGAGTVTVNARVTQDLTILGGVVQVHGDVGDDLRVIGGEVIIGKAVKGDVVVLGGSLSILSTASVEGDVLFYGGELNIEGPVTGAIHGSTETARIDAEVDGDITLSVASQFSLGGNAKTIGNITYESAHELVRAQDAVIANNPRKISNEVLKESTPLKVIAFELLLFGFVATILFTVARRQVRVVAHTGATRTGISGLVGLGVIIIVPFVSIILMVSVLGVLAGISLFVAYLAMLCGACILSPLSLGYLFQFYGMKQDSFTFTTVLMGVVTWVALGLVPTVGAFILFAYFIITLGALSLTLYERLRA